MFCEQPWVCVCKACVCLTNILLSCTVVPGRPYVKVTSLSPSICMLVCFPRVSHVNPIISHSVSVWGGGALPLT